MIEGETSIFNGQELTFKGEASKVQHLEHILLWF
jgi:hypothetical protein